MKWRLGSESNRRRRICNPLHHHSATEPYRSVNSKDARSIQTSLSLSLRIPGFNPRGDAGNYPWYVLRERSIDPQCIVPRAQRRFPRNRCRASRPWEIDRGQKAPQPECGRCNRASEVVDPTSENDQLLKAQVASPRAYDRFYQSLISEVKVFNGTALLSMEELKYTTALPL